MTEIYYVQNEKQYRELLVNLIREKDFEPEDLQNMKIYGCNYQEEEDGCLFCEMEECFLLSHLEDKDITEHVIISELNVSFPLILVLADTFYKDEKLTLISVQEAKKNTKYGYNGYL